MTICEDVRISAYLPGSKIARFSALIGLICPTIATMISGKMTLMPKTAIAIPRVRNLCCRLGSIFFSTVALTTALSNDNEVSNIHRTRTINTACNHPAIFISAPAQMKNPNTTAITLKIIDHLKNSLIIIVYEIKTDAVYVIKIQLISNLFAVLRKILSDDKILGGRYRNRTCCLSHVKRTL